MATVEVKVNAYPGLGRECVLKQGTMAWTLFCGKALRGGAGLIRHEYTMGPDARWALHPITRASAVQGSMLATHSWSVFGGGA